MTSGSWLQLRQIAQEGVSTSGKITRLTPELHNTANYQFWAGGRLFTGNTRIEEGTAVGESVTVYYLANNPDQNCLHPVDLAQEMFVSTMVMAALTLILPVAVFFEYRRRGNASPR